jgi:hypothetical protein
MLNWLIRNRLAAFERTFDYDMSYARTVLDADRGAFFKFARVMGLSQYRKDVPLDVYYAAKLTGTLAEDCGPCTQLVVTMALREGLDPRTLAAILAVDERALSEQTHLGVRFARAVLAHAPEADALRDEIVSRWGPRALVSLAFALTAARIFPTLKYVLGHGRTCRRIMIAGQPVAVAGQPVTVVRGAA